VAIGHGVAQEADKATSEEVARTLARNLAEGEVWPTAREWVEPVSRLLRKDLAEFLPLGFWRAQPDSPALSRGYILAFLCCVLQWTRV